MLDGRCLGCARTLDEIAGWGSMDEAERLRIITDVLPQRMARPQDWQALDRIAIEKALHPLHRPPAGQAWNHQELADLLPAGDQREAAVLLGLVQRPHGINVLLTRRSDQLRQHGGQVSFPGGGIDADDVDPVAAATAQTSRAVPSPPANSSSATPSACRASTAAWVSAALLSGSCAGPSTR